jgi:dTDP-glucose 4,6-dehydratase
MEHILAHTAPLWSQLRGARFFVTGATGFYGKWLLESIIAANDSLGADVRATLLSRNPRSFAAELPRLALRPEFDWIEGGIEDFEFPPGRFDCVCHFATPSAAELEAGNAALAVATLAGTQRVLDFARLAGVRRLLLASSGAVYGPQPPELHLIPETYTGAPDPTNRRSAYGEVKRMAELLCALTPEVECVIARGFAFVGPYLPLNDKFAVGSFIRDALAGGPIRIRGDGTPVRSYLYAADLLIWLLTLLIRGRPFDPYNVGSNVAIGLGDLAKEIAGHGAGVVEVARKASAGTATRYVPDTTKARVELALQVWTPLPAALDRTLAWVQTQP